MLEQMEAFHSFVRFVGVDPVIAATVFDGVRISATAWLPVAAGWAGVFGWKKSRQIIAWVWPASAPDLIGEVVLGVLGKGSWNKTNSSLVSLTNPKTSATLDTNSKLCVFSDKVNITELISRYYQKSIRRMLEHKMLEYKNAQNELEKEQVAKNKQAILDCLLASK